MSAPTLVLGRGGPADAFLRRARLTADRAGYVVRGAVALALGTWLPLLVLSLAAGYAYGPAVALSFRDDLAVHVRLLFALPLLFLADLVVGARLARVAAQLVGGDLVAPADEPRFAAAVQEALRRRDSTTAEAIMLALAFALSWSALSVERLVAGSGWYARPGATGTSLTAAGWWYVVVSLPVFQFLFFRWVWRGFIWARFLALVARLDLRLVASHPDRAGGIGFVGAGQTSFAIVLLAVSAVLSAVIAERVLRSGMHVTDFKEPLGAFVALAVAVTLGPLLVFWRPLAALKREAGAAYSRLATAHHRAFEKRWLGGEGGDALLGSPDVSSAADLNAMFTGVRQLRVLPVDRADLVAVVAAAALPMVPLIALEIPLKEVVRDLLGILL